MRDSYNNTHLDVLTAAATYAADNTPVAVDLRGYDAVTIALSIGAGGITFDTNNKIEFVLTHSDDNSTYTNVALADVIGPTSVTNGIVKSLTSAHATADVTKVGYIGNKRYIKLLADFSGTHGTGTPIGAVVMSSRAFARPVS